MDEMYDPKVLKKYHSLNKKIKFGDYTTDDLLLLGSISLELKFRFEALSCFQQAVNENPELTENLKPKLEELFHPWELNTFVFPYPPLVWDRNMLYALSYPFSSMILFIGGIFFGIIGFSKYTFFTTLVIFGPYLLAYLRSIVDFSLCGQRQPDWPDLTQVPQIGFSPTGYYELFSAHS